MHVMLATENATNNANRKKMVMEHQKLCAVQNNTRYKAIWKYASIWVENARLGEMATSWNKCSELAWGILYIPEPERIMCRGMRSWEVLRAHNIIVGVWMKPMWRVGSAHFVQDMKLNWNIETIRNCEDSAISIHRILQLCPFHSLYIAHIHSIAMDNQLGNG